MRPTARIDPPFGRLRRLNRDLKRPILDSRLTTPARRREAFDDPIRAFFVLGTTFERTEEVKRWTKPGEAPSERSIQ